MSTTTAASQKQSQITTQTSPALKNKKVMIGLSILGLVLFFGMWLSVTTQTLFYAWDEPVNEFFKQLRESAPPLGTAAARLFGKAGSQGITLVTIILLTIWAFRRQARHFWLLFTAVVGVELLWLPVVFGIGRPRPTTVRTVGDVILPGFPSGHVMIFIAFFGALLYLYFMNVKNEYWRTLIAVLVTLLLLLTGFVRLYFNAHYFTDVIAGYGLGLAWTALALLAVESVFLKRQQH